MTKQLLDSVTEKVGGKDILIRIVQNRLKQIYRGENTLVDLEATNIFDVILTEIDKDKLDISELSKPQILPVIRKPALSETAGRIPIARTRPSRIMPVVEPQTRNPRQINRKAGFNRRRP